MQAVFSSIIYYLSNFCGDSGSSLQGSTATVTYSDSYRLTAFSREGDSPYYDYTVPNNPPGTSRDGHIDTEAYIRIGS